MFRSYAFASAGLPSGGQRVQMILAQVRGGPMKRSMVELNGVKYNNLLTDLN